MFVGAKAARNLDLAIEHGTWGWTQKVAQSPGQNMAGETGEERIAALSPGDRLVIATGMPGASVRRDYDPGREVVLERLLRCTVTRSLFRDSTSIWEPTPDKYSFRILFRVDSEESDVDGADVGEPLLRALHASSARGATPFAVNSSLEPDARARGKARYWWSGDESECYWLEVTNRPDIGADLNAPLEDEAGKKQWSYAFVAEPNSGDVVFHFHTPSESIVGRSIIDGDAWPDEVVWGAQGTSARGKEIDPYPRPGLRRALTEHERLEQPLPLTDIRNLEEKVFAVRDALKAKHGGAIYFPFVPYKGQPLRTFQGYLMKLPAELVSLLGLPVSEVSRPNPALSVDRELGQAYRLADETVAVSTAEPMQIDPALQERGLRGHRRTQNMLAREVERAGYVPRSPRSGDPDWDLAWEANGVMFVSEVKSITRSNQEKQLRLGLGQVLRYQQHLRADGRKTQAVLVAERKPEDNSWIELCASVGVKLTWPTAWSELFK